MSTATLPKPTTGSVIVNRARIVSMLEIASGVIKTRTPKPILKCVRLSTADNALTVSATDLICWVGTETRELQVEGEMDTAVPHDRLYGLLREMDEDTVGLRVQADRLIVTGNSAKVSLPTSDPADLPPTPAAEPTSRVSIPTKAFRRLLAQTRFAVRDESRYAFDAICVTVKKDSLTFAATESHVLAVATTPCDAADPFTALIVPAPLVIADKAADSDGVVSFGLTENLALVQAGDTTIYSVLREGQFPPHEDYIPKDTDKLAHVGVEAFSAAVRQCACVIAPDAAGLDAAVRFSFSKGSGISLSASNADGDADVNYPCKFEGSDIAIGFNPKLILSCLRVIETSEATIELTAPSRAVAIRSGSELVCVVMPVNLKA